MKQNKYTAVIIDDEIAAREVLKSLLSDFTEIIVIGMANDGIDGEYLLMKHNPDIAFIDIDMPGKSGVELLRDIHNVLNDIKVIFTTAYERYAIESIKYHPFGYLLKPIGYTQLKEVICHIKNDEKHVQGNNLKANNNSNKLKVSTKLEILFIDFDDILYLVADGNYTNIHLINSDPINVTIQIGKLEKQLPSTIFQRINRSEIANLNYIDKIEKKGKKLILNWEQKSLSLKVQSDKLREIVKILG